MAQISLEQAYTSKQKTAADVAAAQSKLTDLQGRVQAALADLTGTQSADADADRALAAGVARTPDGKAVRTADGKVLLAWNGTVHTLDVIDASAVNFDDGTADTPAPAPDPEPSPEPTPAPAPEPAPDAPPAPAPDDAPGGEPSTASWPLSRG